MDYKCLKCHSLWDVYTWICRMWGSLTAMVLWGVGIEGAFHHVYIGTFIILAAIVVTFFEVVFIIVFWVELCSKDEESFCVRLWQGLMWVDDWKKAILYTPLTVICFLYPKQFWLGVIPGVLLIICALLYAIKSLKARSDRKEEELRAKSQTYDRFDSEVAEDLENNTLGPVKDDALFEDANSLNDNVGDQEDILDV